MKKIWMVIALCLSVTVAFSQAKKPILMVIPSDVWCNANGFTTTFDNQGTLQKVPDYNRALTENMELAQAISKIGELMANREFPLKDLASTMKSLQTEAVEESLTESKDGDMLAETPLEKLQKVAKADILIQLTWAVNQLGPSYSVTYNMQAIDAYTNKQIAASSGTGEKINSKELALLLEAAVVNHITTFAGQLQAHFDDLFKNGREIGLLCRRWSGAEVDFESEFDGEELGFLIEDWVAANTQEGRFSTADASENRMRFEQVRIPMVSESGRAMDARTWARGLQKMLKDKYSLDAKLGTKGLGLAIVTIGAK